MGSKRTDFDDARNYGSVLISAREAAEIGVDGILAKIPKAKNYYLTIDIDGFDMSIAPSGVTAAAAFSFRSGNAISLTASQRWKDCGGRLGEVDPCMIRRERQCCIIDDDARIYKDRGTEKVREEGKQVTVHRAAFRQSCEQ